jgi:uncharacterized RDD family membrane protein YckC
MEEVLDQSFVQPERSAIKYGGFWQRFGAVIIDGLIWSPVSFGITYFNIINWKSPLILVIISLIGVAYKPFMEYTYGATWGKMALKLKVTNLELETASLQEILLRNVFHIVPTLISLVFSIGMYMDPGFQSISGFMEFSTFSEQFTSLQTISYMSGLITIVDAIMLAADSQKRSLHDRIGGTLVLDQS